MLLLYTILIDDENERQHFEKIYLKYRNQMFYIAQSILHNTADSEDAIHEVFFNIASKHLYTLFKLQADNDIKNYLLKATKNTAINIYNKRNRTPIFLDNNIESIENIPTLSDNDFVDTVCSKVLYNDILFAISKLPKIYRDVLYYHFVLEFTVSEIADLLNQKIHTVKKQLVRGKKLLLASLNITGE